MIKRKKYNRGSLSGADSLKDPRAGQQDYLRAWSGSRSISWSGKKSRSGMWIWLDSWSGSDSNSWSEV